MSLLIGVTGESCRLGCNDDVEHVPRPGSAGSSFDGQTQLNAIGVGD